MKRRAEIAAMNRLPMHRAEGSGYVREPYEIEYQDDLATDAGYNVIVNVDQYKARQLALEAGWRLSTAAEEHGLRELSQLKDLLQWTDTGLLIPKGAKRDYIRNENGRKYHLRIVTEGGKPAGELWVPGDGLVKEWSVFGLPAETVPEEYYICEKDTHFLFTPNKNKIGIIRGMRWSIGHEGCVILLANSLYSYSNDDVGFRMVRGPSAEYSTVKAARLTLDDASAPQAVGRRDHGYGLIGNLGRLFMGFLQDGKQK